MDFKAAQAKIDGLTMAVGGTRCSPPGSYWVQFPCSDTPNEVLIAYNGPGTSLWICYEVGLGKPPLKSFQLLTSGRATDIPLGQSTYNVSNNFFLHYDTGGVDDPCKIGFSIS